MADKKLGEGKEKSKGEGAATDKVDATGEDNVKQVKDLLDAQPKTKILIPATELDQEDVKVGICGYTYLIKRDVPVSVPQSVVEVLQQAVVTSYRQVPRKDAEGCELIPFTSMRYPFQIISRQSAGE